MTPVGGVAHYTTPTLGLNSAKAYILTCNHIFCQSKHFLIPCYIHILDVMHFKTDCMQVSLKFACLCNHFPTSVPSSKSAGERKKDTTIRRERVTTLKTKETIKKAKSIWERLRRLVGVVI